MLQSWLNFLKHVRTIIEERVTVLTLVEPDATTRYQIFEDQAHNNTDRQRRRLNITGLHYFCFPLILSGRPSGSWFFVLFLQRSSFKLEFLIILSPFSIKVSCYYLLFFHNSPFYFGNNAVKARAGNTIDACKLHVKLLTKAWMQFTLLTNHENFEVSRWCVVKQNVGRRPWKTVCLLKEEVNYHYHYWPSAKKSRVH